MAVIDGVGKGRSPMVRFVVKNGSIHTGKRWIKTMLMMARHLNHDGVVTWHGMGRAVVMVMSA